MKITRNGPAVLKSLFSIVGAAMIACGCAGIHNEQLTLAPVGPSPQKLADSSSNGGLVVYSALEAGYSYDKYGEMQNQIVRQQFSSYQIYGPNGELRCAVDNGRRNGVLAPELVRIAPGTYWVKAHARGYGRIAVPVVIKEGQQTIVHLEGGQNWPDKSAFTASNAVRLPNGMIVGWKAQAAFAL